MKVIYHASCTDGFTAAWCAWRLYGDDAQYIPANYGDEPPEALGEDILVLDFSYPRRHLEYMAGVANSIRVLDHHKTAEAELSGLPFCTFDMGRSGAGLAWDELHKSRRPLLVDYVEDRDLWRWDLKRSREVSAWISSWDFEFAGWDRLADDLEHEPERRRAIDQGDAILRALDRHVASQGKNSSSFALGGHEVPIINCTYAISEVIGKLAENAPFAVGWFQRTDGRFVYSLRSRGDFDVSEVAKQFGGGGHRNAAGFTADRMVHGG